MRLKGLNKSIKMGHLDLPPYTVVHLHLFITQEVLHRPEQN